MGALLLGIVMAAVVGGALAFEHIGGYIPCALCLEQRVPYYVGAPIMLAAAVAARAGGVTVAKVLVGLGGLAMAYAAYLGIYHSGVEWGWWPGPQDCGAAASVDAIGGGDLLSQIDAVRPPSCNEAAARFLGLSFAGWQVLAAVGLAVGSFALLARRPR